MEIRFFYVCLCVNETIYYYCFTFYQGLTLGPPHEIIDVGETEVPEEIFLDYIENLKQEYTADKYHLLERNCNNFSNDLC